MKSSLVVLGAVLILVVAASLSTQAQTRNARPPGVSAADWAPISPTAGVLLSDAGSGNRLLIPPGPEAPPTVQRRTGILMVLHNGSWLAFEKLGDFSPTIQPLPLSCQALGGRVRESPGDISNEDSI